MAEEDDLVLGTYLLCANQKGGGPHVANCGYVMSPRATGRAMCAHSLDRARAHGFGRCRSTLSCPRTRAVRLWESFGFAVIGRLPEAFAHPTLGFVDALVMHLRL